MFGITLSNYQAVFLLQSWWRRQLHISWITDQFAPLTDWKKFLLSSFCYSCWKLFYILNTQILFSSITKEMKSLHPQHYLNHFPYVTRFFMWLLVFVFVVFFYFLHKGSVTVFPPVCIRSLTCDSQWRRTCRWSPPFPDIMPANREDQGIVSENVPWPCWSFSAHHRRVSEYKFNNVGCAVSMAGPLQWGPGSPEDQDLYPDAPGETPHGRAPAILQLPQTNTGLLASFLCRFFFSSSF